MLDGNRNLVLGSLAAACLLGTGLLWLRGGAQADAVFVSEPAESIRVLCRKCGAEWDMPMADYLTLRARRANKSDRLACERCGASALWKKPFAPSLAGPATPPVMMQGPDDPAPVATPRPGTGAVVRPEE